jgi:hypothetical protein
MTGILQNVKGVKIFLNRVQPVFQALFVFSFGCCNLLAGLKM